MGGRGHTRTHNGAVPQTGLEPAQVLHQPSGSGRTADAAGGSRLQPEGPRRPVRTDPAWRVVAAVWVGCATVLQLYRTPGVPAWDTLWQEDGGIFYTDALRHHLLDALTRSYNGYLHLVPRLLAALAVHLPLRDVAVIFAFSSALVVALVSVYVVWAARVVVPALWARALLAVLVVLVPVGAYETTDNINNLHWYLLFALAWVPFSRPTGRPGQVLNLVVIVLAVLSDSEALLLAPLFLPGFVRAVRTRRPAHAGPAAAVGVCLLVQFVVGAQGQQPGRYAPSRLSDMPGIYAFRVAGSLLLGDRYLPTLYDRHGLAFAYGCLVVLVLLLAGAAVLAPRARLLLLTAAAGSVLFLAVPLMLRGTANFLTRPQATLNGSRYALLPVLFLAAGLLGAAARLAPTLLDRAGQPRVVPAVVGLLTVTVVAYNYADVNVRTAGPSWHAELSHAVRTCASTHDLPRELDTNSLPVNSAPGNPWGTPAGPGDVIVPVAPSLPKIIPFSVLIDCRRLRGDLP